MMNRARPLGHEPLAVPCGDARVAPCLVFLREPPCDRTGRCCVLCRTSPLSHADRASPAARPLVLLWRFGLRSRGNVCFPLRLVEGEQVPLCSASFSRWQRRQDTRCHRAGGTSLVCAIPWRGAAQPRVPPHPWQRGQQLPCAAIGTALAGRSPSLISRQLCAKGSGRLLHP